MKKFSFIQAGLIIGMLLVLGSVAQANTVTVSLEFTDDVGVSDFLVTLDPTKSYPLLYDSETNASDCTYYLGNAVANPSLWLTLPDFEEISSDDSDQYRQYLKGVVGLPLFDNSPMQDGTLLTISSENYDFAIDMLDDGLGDQGILFKDFAGNEVSSGYAIIETWDGGDQHLLVQFNASPVPLPASFVLMASGLVGLVGIKRKKMQ